MDLDTRILEYDGTPRSRSHISCFEEPERPIYPPASKAHTSPKAAHGFKTLADSAQEMGWSTDMKLFWRHLLRVKDTVQGVKNDLLGDARGGTAKSAKTMWALH